MKLQDEILHVRREPIHYAAWWQHSRKGSKEFTIPACATSKAREYARNRPGAVKLARPLGGIGWGFALIL